MLRRLLLGGASGLIATLPMTMVMMALHRRLPLRQRHPLPPEHIVAGLRSKLGMGRMDEAHDVQVAVAHFGYGAGVGSLYFASLPWLQAIPVRGPAYGLLVWVVSYFGVLPGAGLLPPASEESRHRNALMIIAHLVWGSALQVCEHVFNRRHASSQRP